VKRHDLVLAIGQPVLTGNMIGLTILMRGLCVVVLVVGKLEFELASVNVVDF
jgi:hypothetical protein